jgi:hypothetical protein
MLLKWLLAVLIALLSGYFSWQDAYQFRQLANARQNDPQRFYRGEVSVTEAKSIISKARAALSSEPLLQHEVRDLALASLVNGDRRGILQLGLAQQLSRRDAATQLALMEYAGSQNAYSVAARHLDRIVTVYPEIGRGILDGDMGFFIAHPHARSALAQYAGRPWFAGFIIRAIARSKEPDDLIELALRSNIELSSMDASALSGMLASLLDQGRFGAATGIAAKWARSDPGALVDFGLSAATTRQDLAPLSWKIANDNRVSSQWSSKEGLNVDLGVGNPVDILERRTQFSAGDYQVEQRVGELRGNAGMEVMWSLDCMTGGDAVSVWRQPVPLNRSLVHYRSRVRLPQNCPLQRWRFSAGAIDGQTGASFRLASLSLSPD